MSVASGMVTSMERKIWMAAELEAKNRTADLPIRMSTVIARRCTHHGPCGAFGRAWSRIS